MKPKHTPGPWAFDANCVVTEDNTTGIAILEQIAEFWEGEAQPCEDWDEVCANGRLLAAAPELLLACRLAIGSLEAAGFDNATMKLCKRAVEKATKIK